MKIGILPISHYEFPERARIMEASYGPDAETLDDDLALTRRIQVTKDLTARCGLSEPTRRGKTFNYVCIICFRSGRRPRKFRRIDSLRRHLTGVHFKHTTNGTAIHYTLHSSKTVGAFTDVATFLRPAATVRDYDPKI